MYEQTIFYSLVNFVHDAKFSFKCLSEGELQGVRAAILFIAIFVNNNITTLYISRYNIICHIIDGVEDDDEDADADNAMTMMIMKMKTIMKTMTILHIPVQEYSPGDVTTT